MIFALTFKLFTRNFQTSCLSINSSLQIVEINILSFGVYSTPTNYEIKIQNVITTADLKQKVDATKFKNYPWGTYDIEYYGGRCGYVKDYSMSGRVTVFLSGKMISTGAKSTVKSIEQLHRL